MKDAKMNVETLSRAELLTLLSVLEGELEAQDVVIHALRAQHRDSFVQQRYGQYDLSDPFLALQRDSEPQDRPLLLQPDGHLGRQRHPVGPNPLAVLKLVMAHCQRTQETMVGQLAAAEARHKKMMGELQEEQRHSVQTSTHNQQLVCRLQSHNQQLLQQLEVERAAVQRLEQEQVAAAQQVEESLSQQQQQSATLRLQLQEEALKASELQGLLEEERRRAGQAEAQWEAELQQVKARLGGEEARSRELERLLEELRKEVTEARRVAGPGSKVNGHKASREAEEGGDGGGGAPPPQPLQHPQSPSSLSSSPASSPVLAKRPPGPALLPSSYQAGVNQRFQAARHKFQSQAELEQQQQFGGGALSPRDLSPVASPPPAPLPAEHSAARQLARHTVTQVLSRFTGQQAALKLPAANSSSSSSSNNSPFGTDYRNLATGGRSPSSPLPPPLASRSSPLSPASRTDKTPPPAPPKKPGMMSPAPGSPSHCSRSSSSNSNSHFPELTGNCGHAGSSSGADGAAAVTSQS